MSCLQAIVPPSDRPYTIANFVASADGMAAVQGRSGALSDPGDRALFHALREQVDGVLVGTRTLAVERYGRIVKSQEGRARRLAGGHASEPIACVISSSGLIPAGIPLFAEPEARIVLFSPIAPDPAAFAAQVTFVLTDPAERRPLALALRVLRDKHGVGTLLCEGGPTLMRALLAEQLVDELFLTLAPALAGGASGPTIIGAPPLPEPLALSLLWLLTHADALYLRYAIL